MIPRIFLMKNDHVSRFVEFIVFGFDINKYNDSSSHNISNSFYGNNCAIYNIQLCIGDFSALGRFSTKEFLKQQNIQIDKLREARIIKSNYFCA